MQNDFQLNAHRILAEFAERNQLSPYPLLDSGNGIEYKNHLNGTVFTVYHDRLDDRNYGQIELAIGWENIATELSRPPSDISAWVKRIELLLHPAKMKSPKYWPRISICSISDIQLFFHSFDELSASGPREVETGQTVSDPTIMNNQYQVDERVKREIWTRRGQPEFRANLIDAYGARCAISDCPDLPVLEAAHITAHSETQNYNPSNGLLLRADLHTLFDLYLLSIDPRSGTVVVSNRLSSTYQYFNGRTLRLPDQQSLQPDPSALMRHYGGWQAQG